ncbi:MAG TPA: UDP-N-acetylmuramoyl-L-alanine--D-glutamate ligase [Phycisphaerae bacterium]|nr:UDP-N-acetylmuramoyl-L-alanine--D-glutamate ligase [Phycisphaerae bacterium]HRY68839.1 UDP-N-acetylmuramoyl-L-alanine--D-glutamate ligase [Phycisphaerae bacterium]HSA27504.1 UDP-N-acetylmuramoyl-L-alanine--D-glutamate ligase [Phycisphaerae bacterium]
MAAGVLTGQRVVVMGLGHFGGGIAVTRWLVEQGALVTVTDTAKPDKLADGLRQIADLPVGLRLGEHALSDLDDCRLLVVSPAVPKDRSDYVREARGRGIPVTSEMNLFIERCPARRMVGVTGSAGKSTTTAMIGAVLETACVAGRGPRVWVGGNIGRSLLADLPVMTAEDVVVLELSSFQLEDLEGLRWSPPLAVITNIEPNHLDRHGTLEAYAAAKLNLVRFQGPGGLVFVHETDEGVARRVAEAGAGQRLRGVRFDSSLASSLRLPGRHNQDNAALAVAVCRSLGVEEPLIRRGLSGFAGLPHRLEYVGESRGVGYYNDSKSTTPASTCLAVDSFDRPVIVLIGGRDKGMPFDEMNAHLAARAKGVVCYGEMGHSLHEGVRACVHAVAGKTAVVEASTLEAAVRAARDLSVPGDVVVLSPACTSYDLFANYEQRGEEFRRLVHALPS